MWKLPKSNQSGNRDVCQTPLLSKELVSDAMMPFESRGVGVGGGREGGVSYVMSTFFSQYDLWSLLEQPSTALVLCSLLISAEFQLSTLY